MRLVNDLFGDVKRGGFGVFENNGEEGGRSS